MSNLLVMPDSIFKHKDATYSLNTRENVIDLLVTLAGDRLRVGNLTKFFEREIDIFFSDGYDLQEYRTVFFCVKGSPNKLYGYMVIREKMNSSGQDFTEIEIFSNLGNYMYIHPANEDSEGELFEEIKK